MKNYVEMMKEHFLARAQERKVSASGFNYNNADGASLYIYDYIGYGGVEAENIVEKIAAIDSDCINIYINSPGGTVFEAWTMVSALDRWRNEKAGRTIKAHIDGYAASAATFFLTVANTVMASESSLLMVHRSWVMAVGTGDELRASAEICDKIDGFITNSYSKLTGASVDQVTEWMNAETWFTAKEAQDAGFVDEVIEHTKNKDSAEASAEAKKLLQAAYKNCPPDKDDGVAGDVEQGPLLAQDKARLQLAEKWFV